MFALVDGVWPRLTTEFAMERGERFCPARGQKVSTSQQEPVRDRAQVAEMVERWQRGEHTRIDRGEKRAGGQNNIDPGDAAFFGDQRGHVKQFPDDEQIRSGTGFIEVGIRLAHGGEDHLTHQSLAPATGIAESADLLRLRFEIGTDRVKSPAVPCHVIPEPF